MLLSPRVIGRGLDLSGGMCSTGWVLAFFHIALSALAARVRQTPAGPPGGDRT